MDEEQYEMLKPYLPLAIAACAGSVVTCGVIVICKSVRILIRKNGEKYKAVTDSLSQGVTDTTEEMQNTVTEVNNFTNTIVGDTLKITNDIVGGVLETADAVVSQTLKPIELHSQNQSDKVPLTGDEETGVHI